MDLGKHITLSTLSHAYAIEGERAEELSSLRELFHTFGISTVGNPDYHEYVTETFLIDDARELRRIGGYRGAEGGKKIFVIAPHTIHHESQNALLKTLEEPTADTHYFILVRTVEQLLPTVQSRLQILRAHGESSARPSLPLAEKFLHATVSERMALILPITKAKTEHKQKAKEDARILVEALESHLTPLLANGDAQIARTLTDILYAKRELSSRSPSVKILLEHLALTVPKI
jgi:hypothetical protein